jgi:CPA2 family monovalent cation:H+ antiporter-2
VTALVQDLAVIFMLTTIPAMAGDAKDVPAELALAIVKAGALLITVLVGGTWLLPRVLGRVAASRARELFLVAIVAMALGTAAVSAEAGCQLPSGIPAGLPLESVLIALDGSSTSARDLRGRVLRGTDVD